MTISLYLFTGIVVLLLLLVMLVWLYIYRRQQGDNTVNKKQVQVQDTFRAPTFQALQEIIASNATTLEMLEQAVDDIIKYYGSIDDVNDYIVVIQNICRHRNVKAKTIVDFERALCNKNPVYAQQIEKALQQALASRG